MKIKNLYNSIKRSPAAQFATVFVLLFIGLGLAFSYQFYKKAYISDIETPDNKAVILDIPSYSTFADLKKLLHDKGIIIDTASFAWLAKKKKYGSKIRAGRFTIEAGMSNNELINLLRSGKQTPVKLVINNIRTKEELARKISEQIEADFVSIIELLNDKEYISDYGFDEYSILSMFTPNTYEFYWNSSAEQFFDRINKEYLKFWNETRLKKAKKNNMTQIEVSILASIVQAEQGKYNDEKSIIAGLYINRIKKGMLLQADPTLIYALGDFSIKRVLKKHKSIDSPYNTYLNKGLPPGPINLPEISSIDAVLNYKTHKYFYMCAKEDFSGRHHFSKTFKQHNIYAKKYQRALNRRNVMN